MSDYSAWWPGSCTECAVEKELTVAELTWARTPWPISGDHLARATRD